MVCNQPPRSTQPGHPYGGRRNEYLGSHYKLVFGRGLLKHETIATLWVNAAKKTLLQN